MSPRIVIDGTHYARRALHSTRTDDVAGDAMAILEGIVAYLDQRVFASDEPPTIHVVFDPRAAYRTWRHDLLPAYKQGRKPIDDELFWRDQCDKLVRYCRDKWGFEGVIRSPYYEGDDVIGTLAAHFANHGEQVVIVSEDKDFAQCLAWSDRIAIYRRSRDHNDNKEWITRANFADHYAPIPVECWPDLLAIAGDTSDNIKGAVGIGEKKAAKLINALHWPTLGMPFSIAHLYAVLDFEARAQSVGAALAAEAPWNPMLPQIENLVRSLGELLDGANGPLRKQHAERGIDAPHTIRQALVEARADNDRLSLNLQLTTIRRDALPPHVLARLAQGKAGAA